MKQVFISLFLMAALSAHGQSRVEQISDFLDGIISFEEAGFNEHNPILTVNSLAAEQADEVMQMTESIIGEIIEKGREFSHCLITVDQHTMVLITDWDNCKQSGSWNTCMPYGKGFIQRGELESHEDHINNIIGTPDAKRRTAFFLNKETKKQYPQINSMKLSKKSLYFKCVLTIPHFTDSRRALKGRQLQ